MEWHEGKFGINPKFLAKQQTSWNITAISTFMKSSLSCWNTVCWMMPTTEQLYNLCNMGMEIWHKFITVCGSISSRRSSIATEKCNCMLLLVQLLLARHMRWTHHWWAADHFVKILTAQDNLVQVLSGRYDLSLRTYIETVSKWVKEKQAWFRGVQLV